MSKRNDEINEQAAIWAARVASGNLAPEERVRLDAWRAVDIRHVGAFARAQAILLRLDRLRAVGAEALREAIPEIPSAGIVLEPAQDVPDSLVAKDGDAVPVGSFATECSPVWTRRQVMLTGSAAASVAAVGIVSAMHWSEQSPKPAAAQTEYFSTRIGETRPVQLADGSVITLNTNSRIAVSYTDGARNIRLEHGEALFKVAKNKKRPFIVRAGDTQVRAVGTSFTVQHLPDRPIRILVQEGVVEVAKRDVRGAKPVRAIAETQAVVATSAPIAVKVLPRTQVERNLAWRYGQISFENETLAEAAEEFARYGDMKIAVDPAIAHRTITGMFAANDPVGFAKAAASVLDLHIEVQPKEVWIVR